MRYISIVILVSIPFLTTLVFAENTKQVEIFAHHGVLEDVPENTFAALKRAVELGIDGVEIDIRQTKDKHLILMCDETIDRTTDGKGRVDQLLYAEIRQYDAGSWHGEEFKGEKVPLLSDVLKFCKINNLKLILNAKQPCMEKQILDLVKTSEMSSRVYLWGTLRTINKAEYIEPFGNPLVFVSQEESKEETIRRIHDEKKYAFSILLGTDNRKDIKDQIKAGIDVILVDYPCVAADILNIKSQSISHKRPIKKIDINSTSQEETNDNTAYIQEKVNDLLKTIEGEDYDKARTATLALMVLPQKNTVSPLLKLLKNKQPQTKQNAVWALGFCGDESIAEHIHPLLNDKNTEVRREAVLALKRLGAKQSVPILIETIKTETDREVKYDIARTLGTLGDQSTVFTLANIITQEKNWFVKSACVGALRHIGSDKAINILANILTTDAGDDAAWARTNAAWALAAIGEKSIHLLTTSLMDKEEATRRRAGWALIKIGAPAVKELINSLRDTNDFTRSRAAQILGWIGDDSAATSLIWALKDNEPSVVSAAAWALGRIGSPKALPPLKTLANNKNSDIRENSIEAVERIVANKEKMADYKESEQKS